MKFRGVVLPPAAFVSHRCMFVSTRASEELDARQETWAYHAETLTVMPLELISSSQIDSTAGFRLLMTKCLAPRCDTHSQSDSPSPPVRPTSQYVLLSENETRASTAHALTETGDFGPHSMMVSWSKSVSSIPMMEARAVAGICSRIHLFVLAGSVKIVAAHCTARSRRN